MTTEFIDKKETIYDFYDRIDVECPDCGAHAIVRNTTDKSWMFSPRRFSCTSCGKHKEWKESGLGAVTDSDPYFGYKLWFLANSCGHTLFALNEKHLDFLHSYVEATHRKRPRKENDEMIRNGTLASRFPAWMKSAKNRDDVLRSIEKLKQNKGSANKAVLTTPEAAPPTS